MPPFDPAKLLDVGRWFDTQPGPASTWYVILGVFFALAIAIGIYVYNFVPRIWFHDDRYRAGLARNIAQGVIWIAVSGFTVCLFRVLDVGFFGMRVWLLFLALLSLTLIMYLIYYFRVTYRENLEHIARQKQYREFLPKQSPTRGKAV